MAYAILSAQCRFFCIEMILCFRKSRWWASEWENISSTCNNWRANSDEPFYQTCKTSPSPDRH